MIILFNQLKLFKNSLSVHQQKLCCIFEVDVGEFDSMFQATVYFLNNPRILDSFVIPVVICSDHISNALIAYNENLDRDPDSFFRMPTKHRIQSKICARLYLSQSKMKNNRYDIKSYANSRSINGSNTKSNT